ncbi:MAG: T9SS type A sorting domain-containing protein [Ignavibacteria bacterium]|nr:T9SS type A sorting domain-containing protein [Ignavibacteria bacterium]
MKRVYFVLLILLVSSVHHALGQEIRTLARQDWIELKAVYEDMYTRIGPPAEFVTQRSPTANFIVTYNGFSPAAQTAFQFAVNIWAALIGSPVTIRVTANWTSLATGVLGSAAANGAVRDFPGAPQSGTWYVMPLAEMLFGGNVNDPDSADIIANFNMDRSDWYLGTDGSTPPGEFDLVSVVLHELCHGLGFAGSMTVSGSMGSWGLGSGFPFAYDPFPENGSGQQLIDSTIFANPSAALAAQLTGDDIYFDSPNAVTANGGSPPKLFAPASWNQGSSYSHLDETTFSAGDPNSLMTPQLGQAEAIHSPGAITVGMFEDIGWTIITSIDDPTRTSQEIPKEIVLYQNYPNPFNPVTHIGFTLSKASDVRIEVYNNLGQKITTLLDDQRPAGLHVVDFEASEFSSGTYFYKIQAADFVQVNKMVLMK